MDPEMGRKFGGGILIDAVIGGDQFWLSAL